MTSALLGGFTGLALCLGIGLQVLNLSLVDILLGVLASNLAALIALLLTLWAEKISWVKKYKLNHYILTWAFFVTVYFGVFLGLLPQFADLFILVRMLFPLILSTGFAMIAFGPIQDRIVWRQQKKMKSQAG